jgi:hypothetical protein
MADDQGSGGGDQGQRDWFWRLWTFQSVALLVFVGLAATTVLVALMSLIVPSPASDSFLVTRTLSVLVTLAVSCAVLAWLDQANARMFAKGVRHLLTVNRAAIAAFIAAGAATIGVCLFVAFAALFSGRVQHGLYILAAIQFLLKLAAVSAIIVLITLRRASPINGQQAADAEEAEGGDKDQKVVEAPEDRGRLEFGSLAFAFGLVVIAGLVMPNEDLMRLSSMFFGGEKKIEDYLPRQPILALDDDLGDLIVTSVSSSPGFQRIVENLDADDEQSIKAAIRSSVRTVMYDTAIANARRTGTLDILDRICHGTQEDILFANSTNRVLADHLSYLVGEGLIRIVYDDLTSMMVTEYGDEVMYKHAGVHCDGYEEDLQAIVDTARMLTDGARIIISIDESPKSFGLNLEPGSYFAALVSQDDGDPVLQLIDKEGTILQEDDDSGPGPYDATIYFTVDSANQGLVLRAKTFGDLSGNAELFVSEASAEVPQAADRASSRAASAATTAEALAQRPPETTLGGDNLTTRIMVLPRGGAVIGYAPTSPGQHAIDIELLAGLSRQGLIATLFERSGEGPIRISEAAIGMNGGSAVITSDMVAGRTYALVLQHRDRVSEPSIVSVVVRPPSVTPAPSPAEQDEQTITPNAAADENSTPEPAPVPAEPVEAPAAPPPTLP